LCGINGYWQAWGGREDDLLGIGAGMNAALLHRGPDSGGLWSDTGTGLVLGHRRLSILDLSPHGAQPIVSRDGHHVLVFNGEIYNHLEVRSVVDSHAPLEWRGHSDTETLVEAIATLGFEKTLSIISGMFAFAVWDRRMGVLRLAIDRMGEKPLYFGSREGRFFFASEPKAFFGLPGWRGDVDRDALALFFRYNSIPAPHTIWRGVCKLEPGSALEVRIGSGKMHSIHTRRYWDLRDVARTSFANRFSGSPQDAVEVLEEKLRAVIGRQMLSDVPLGAFLSGGVDSSTVVAIMQAISGEPVKTFTIGFDSRGYNESDDAARVAAHLGTDHTTLVLDWREALDLIPRIPDIWSEPFADSSQLPTLLVSALARKHVTVSLSGDGGDELFGGYNRHLWMNGLGRRVQGMPYPLRKSAAATLNIVPATKWDEFFERFNGVFPRWLQLRVGGEKIQKLRDALGARDALDLYQTLVSQWREPAVLIPGVREPSGWVEDARNWEWCPDPVERVMLLDMLTYLPRDILAKVDRASMAVSLESRVPFLDPDLVAFALSLPVDYKIREGQGKWILRQVLYRYVPREIVERPKMGFSVPLDAWLRGPLREWAESLLAEDRLRREGFLNPEPVRRLWNEQCSGKGVNAQALWNVLMFQSWLERHAGGGKP
jgi:asparagine synthase (glutamine-hydrolysing)